MTCLWCALLKCLGRSPILSGDIVALLSLIKLVMSGTICCCHPSYWLVFGQKFHVKTENRVFLEQKVVKKGRFPVILNRYNRGTNFQTISASSFCYVILHCSQADRVDAMKASSPLAGIELSPWPCYGCKACMWCKGESAARCTVARECNVVRWRRS